MTRQSVHSIVGVIGDALVDLDPADQRRALKAVFVALGLEDSSNDLIGARVRLVNRGSRDEVIGRGVVRQVQASGGTIYLLISILDKDHLSGLLSISLYDESTEVFVEDPDGPT